MPRQITRCSFLRAAGVAGSAILVRELLIGNSTVQAASSYVRRDIVSLIVETQKRQ